jgi:hypothetical protein
LALGKRFQQYDPFNPRIITKTGRSLIEMRSVFKVTATEERADKFEEKDFFYFINPSRDTP